jgi:putative toxin-antitoxin system antitoxin component (TIGR02293 family)
MSAKKKPKPYPIESPLQMVHEPPAAEMIRYIRQGVPFREFNTLLDKGPFSLKEWAHLLHLSERTIYRYESGNKSFDPLQSDRIIEIERLNRKGSELFGDMARFKAWLISPSMALGGVSPMQLLDSQAGITLVQDELGRIAHGIPA